MAAITTIINGTQFKLWAMVSGTYKEIAYGTSNDVDLARTMIEVSNKTDGAFAKFIAGRKNGKFTVAANMINDASAGTYVSFMDLVNYWNNGTEVYFQIGTGLTGNDYVAASALISNLKLTAADDSAVTFSVDLQMTGTIAFGTS
jgi:predicted secreted protein